MNKDKKMNKRLIMLGTILVIICFVGKLIFNIAKNIKVDEFTPAGVGFY